MRIWYHGTNYRNSRAILRDGFAEGTYFAAALQDAIEFGGSYVFEVALAHEPKRDDAWQMCVGDAVPASAIVSLMQYFAVALADYPERREAVLQANQAADAA